MDNRNALNEAQHDAVVALEDGQRLLMTIGASRVGQRFKAVPERVKHLAGVVADPARFWGAAATVALGNGGGDGVEGKTAADISSIAIRVAAAKLKAGAFDSIREALLGQAAWLSANAVRLMAMADEVEGHNAHQRRVEFMKLALRASDQAAKVLASAAALNAINGNAVTVGDFFNQERER